MIILGYSNCESWMDRYLLDAHTVAHPCYKPKGETNLHLCMCKHSLRQVTQDASDMLKQKKVFKHISCWEVTYRSTSKTHIKHLYVKEHDDPFGHILNSSFIPKIKYMSITFDEDELFSEINIQGDTGLFQIRIEPATCCMYCDEPFVDGYGFEVTSEVNCCNECVDDMINDILHTDTMCVVFGNRQGEVYMCEEIIDIHNNQSKKAGYQCETLPDTDESNYIDLFRTSSQWSRFKNKDL